jgi:hypothetical protein
VQFFTRPSVAPILVTVLSSLVSSLWKSSNEVMNVDTDREWLIKWLSTPKDDLNGRKPAQFLGHEDFDLVLVGILIKDQTANAWNDSCLTSEAES